MSHLNYQITVQWSHRNRRYEAYSSTIIDFANRFVPHFPKIAYGATVADAVSNYMIQLDKFLAVLKGLAILPPPPDVGSVDPTESYGEDDWSLGKEIKDYVG